VIYRKQKMLINTKSKAKTVELKIDNRDKSIYILSQPQNWKHDSFEDIKLSADEPADLS
jgi:hypothetical protein